MPESGQKLLLVGCGKMGGALLRSIVAADIVSDIVVVEPMATPSLLPKGVTWLSSLDQADKSYQPDVVILAIKPQLFTETLPHYGRFTKAVFLSIAAGVTLATIATLLENPKAAIIRTMPNLPASIGQGITVGVVNNNVSSQQRDLCDRLMSAVGKMEWIEKEYLLDSVTALSGSGPAYVFALCEAMADAGVSLGLSKDMAERLARQTIIGSGALLAEANDGVIDLRRAVTSPKGTTEAALTKLLADDGLNPLVRKAMEAAAKRAEELSK